MSAGTLYVAIKGDTKDLVTALKSAKNASVSYGKGAKQAIDPVGVAVDGLKRNVMALGATWLGAQGIKAVVSIADQYALLDSKIRLVSQNTSEFNSVYSSLFDISQKTGSSFASNAANYSNLSLALKDTNITSEETLKVFESVNKSLVVAGATTAEASSFMLQFRQAMGSGKLAGDEFRGMMESNSYWGGQLAKALDTDVAGLRQMSKDGKLTTDVLRKAFPAMAAQIDKDFSGINKTIARAMVELSNAFNDVIADANRTAGGTESIATAVSDLALTITQNKAGISSLFISMINLASETASAIGNIGQSIKGWAAVKEGKLSFLKFATMDAKDLKKWLEDVESGVVDLDNRLDDLADKRKEVAMSFAFTSESRKNKEEHLKAIDDQIKAVEAQKRAIINMVDVTERSVKDSWEVKATLSDSLTEKIIENNTRTVEDTTKKEREALEKHIEVETKRYEESKKTTDMQIMAMNGLANAQGVAADSFMRLEELKSESAKEATQEIETYYIDAAEIVKDDFARETSDFLVNSFDNIGDAWDGLWSGMVSAMSKAVSTMAVSWITSGLNKLLGVNYFHDGAWNLKSDEGLSVLQEGEMVIPKDTADKIREIFPNGGFSDINAIADSLSGSISDFGSMPADRNLGKDLSSALGSGFKGTLAAAISGQVSPTQALTGLFTALNPASLAFIVGGSLSKTAAESYEAKGSYGSFGASLGALGTALGLGALGVMGPAAGIGALFGSVAGSWGLDAIGDALDDREFESLRDAVESGAMTPSEFESRMGVAGNLGLSGGSKFGGFMNDVESALDAAFDALGLKGAIDAVRQYGSAAFDAIGIGGNGGQNAGAFGGGDAGDYGGSMGRGGFGSEGNMGVDNEGYAHSGGYLTEIGEGRLTALSGEGVVSRAGMRNLDKINKGIFGGEGMAEIRAELAEIRRILFSGLTSSNKNTSRTTELLTKIDAIGLATR